VHGGLVWDWADVSVFDLDVKTLLLRQVEELVVDVMGVLHIFFEADDGKAFELLGLVHH
jgi:hypothetical protein